MRERIEGIKQALEGSKVELIDVRGDDIDQTRAKKNVEDALAANPDISCLVGIYSYNTPRIYEVLKKSGQLGKIKVIGFDEDPITLGGVREGTIEGTVVQNPYEWGRQGTQPSSARSPPAASSPLRHRRCDERRHLQGLDRADARPGLRPGDIVVMDNLAAHKVAGVRDAIQARGASCYLPPYSPDLNPIEQAFAKLKALLRKAAERTVDGPSTAIGRLLDLFPPAECANYLANSGYPR